MIQLRFARRLLMTATVGVVVSSAVALAQEDAAGVQYKKKTVINFEDDTIEGDLKTPDGQYLEVRAVMRHRSLIRIRTEFRREVLGSIADL
ncbi:MAG: adventurous gliding motility protein CglF [Myxococcota bacterium]